MGWSNCGTDSKGRSIGYAFEATCDHPGCDKKIDRGVAYACGTMHGEGNKYNEEVGCENYFCEEHLIYVKLSSGECIQICKECYDSCIWDDDNMFIRYKDE